ncbi:MAG: IBR domain-containing protein [Candidatus Babeliales bacterium]|nr:IBR domain-containing protein [Candidatus Babeliales bacterium]
MLHSMFNRLILCSLLFCACLSWGISHYDANYLTQQWILKHTKACPNCAIPIEKNGGCDWMKCTVCAHEFCWECLATHDHNIAAHKHFQK